MNGSHNDLMFNVKVNNDYFAWCRKNLPNLQPIFSEYLSEKLQILQTRTTRVTTKLAFDTNSDHVMSTLDWERLSIQRK